MLSKRVLPDSLLLRLLGNGIVAHLKVLHKARKALKIRCGQFLVGSLDVVPTFSPE